MSLLKTLYRETLLGKTLGRTLQNVEFSKIHLEGQGVDLGSKWNKASYYRYLQLAAETEVIFTDINPQSKDVLAIDLEKKLPLADNSKDFLILSNVLEHLKEYQFCIDETYRVLKKDGRLIGSVPFLHQIHLDPDDCFRYSASSLKRIFEKAGYEEIDVIPLGFGPCTAAAFFIFPLIRPKIFRFFAYVMSIKTDQFLNRLFPKNNRVKKENFPLHYFFICTKLNEKHKQ